MVVVQCSATHSTTKSGAARADVNWSPGVKRGHGLDEDIQRVDREINVRSVGLAYWRDGMKLRVLKRIKSSHEITLAECSAIVIAHSNYRESKWGEGRKLSYTPYY